MDLIDPEQSLSLSEVYRYFNIYSQRSLEKLLTGGLTLIPAVCVERMRLD